MRRAEVEKGQEPGFRPRGKLQIGEVIDLELTQDAGIAFREGKCDTTHGRPVRAALLGERTR